MFPNHNDFQHGMIDLHGRSEAEAKYDVLHWLSHSSRNNLNKIRFVTGRGNHVNAKGNRGILYKSFLSWVSESAYKDRIDRCEEHDGYFEVYLKPTHIENPVESFLKNINDQILRDNIEEIKKRAEAGEAEYQVLYAKHLEKYAPGDFKEVFHFFKLAAEQNLTSGIYEVARCYWHGIGVRQSDPLAFKWFEKGDRLGDVFATVALGDCYVLGHGTVPDARTAVALWAKAAKKKNPLALRKIASAYLEGAGVPEKKPELAFLYYKESADLGDTKSQFNTAVMYLNGQGVKENEELAVKYFRLSAEGGDPDAQCNLAKFLLRNKNIKDDEEGMRWLKKAAANGSSEANGLLARRSNEKEAEEYRKKAAATGNVIFAIEQQVQDKNLTDQEFDKIFDENIRRFSNLDINDIILLDRTSRFFLIDNMLIDGKPKQQSKAWQALNSMVEQKCIYSLRRLALFYFDGLPGLKITQNLPKFIECLEKGVAWNDPKAMGLLGSCYDNGNGVKKSPQKALEYYQMAAKHNHPAAYYSIACVEMRKLSSTPEEANIPMIIEYLELAIRYENDKDVMYELNSGSLDTYKSIKEEASQYLENMQILMHDLQTYYKEILNREKEKRSKPQQSATKILETLSKQRVVTVNASETVISSPIVEMPVQAETKISEEVPQNPSFDDENENTYNNNIWSSCKII